MSGPTPITGWSTITSAAASVSVARLSSELSTSAAVPGSPNPPAAASDVSLFP